MPVGFFLFSFLEEGSVMEFEDIGSLIRALRCILTEAASYYQASVAGRESPEGKWYRLLQGKLNEARAILERVPNGDLLDVLNMFLGGENWKSTADVVKEFLYGYLAGRFEELNSMRLQGVKY